MKLNPNFILKRIGDAASLVPFGQALVDFNCMLTFNNVGAFLAETLQEERTLEELTKAVVAKYDVDDETAKKDVEAFVKKLREDKLLLEDEK